MFAPRKLLGSCSLCKQKLAVQYLHYYNIANLLWVPGDERRNSINKIDLWWLEWCENFVLWQASSGDYILWNTLGKCPSAALPKELWLSMFFAGHGHVRSSPVCLPTMVSLLHFLLSELCWKFLVFLIQEFLFQVGKATNLQIFFRTFWHTELRFVVRMQSCIWSHGLRSNIFF